MHRLIVFTVVLFALGAASPLLSKRASAQATSGQFVPAPEARQSPMAMATARVGDAYLKIVYGSPRMRARTIFGGLVPYGQIWRTGANETTEITVTAPVVFGGSRLAAGTYSVFSVPGPDAWEVVLNDGLGQWGAYEYDDSLDVLRVTVPVEDAGATHEAFTIRFDEAEDGADLVMMWENTLIRVPIRAH